MYQSDPSGFYIFEYSQNDSEKLHALFKIMAELEIKIIAPKSYINWKWALKLKMSII